MDQRKASRARAGRAFDTQAFLDSNGVAKIVVEDRRPSRRAPRASAPFDAQAFLDSSGIAKTVVECPRGETIFRQGDPCADVLYIQTGGVKLSALSKTGQESAVAMFGPGDFFGEACLAGQPIRMGTAVATTPSVVLLVGKRKMVRLLHQQQAMADRLISHMLSRDVRKEEHLLDQLFNSNEKRLARTLFLLSRDGKPDSPARAIPLVSPLRLAAATAVKTGSRVDSFLNRFKRFGFIEYHGENGLKINRWLLSVVLHDRGISEDHSGRWWC